MTVPVERLQKILAAAGIASRRGAEALIAAGRVTVDGQVATLGRLADAATQAIAVDRRPIPATAIAPIYLALHKPAGVTATVRDRHAARTVLDLVPSELRPEGSRLYPVGRLDQDSEGLLLLTNDGTWADRILHPRYGVEREYAVGLGRALGHDQAQALLAGIELEEGVARLVGLRPATRTETQRLTAVLAPLGGAAAAPAGPAQARPEALAWYRVTLAQGWKRQLRRMFAAVDAPVRRLVRVRVGTLRLEDLSSGEVRALSSREARRVLQAAGPYAHESPARGQEDERRPPPDRPGRDDILGS